MSDKKLLTPQRFGGIVALGLAAVCAVFGVYLPSRVVLVSGEWTATPCTILTSVVAENEETEPWGNNTRAYTVFEPAITYRYTIDGQAYTSSAVSLKAAQSRDRAWAEEVVARYPVESEKTCYVDTQKPELAVLEPITRGAEQYVFAAGAAVMFLTGLYLVIRG